MKVLFVCLGNICRSPLALGIARSKTQSITFDSAGLSGYHRGESPCKGSQKIAKEYGVSLEGIYSRPVRYPKDDEFDLLVCMDSENYEALIDLGFEKSKIKKMGDFGRGGEDVPDPYYYVEMEGFRKVYLMLEECIERMIEELGAKDENMGN